MVKLTDNEIKKLSKSELLIITLCLLGLVILFIWYRDYDKNNKSYDYSISINSDHLIEEKANLDIDYYLVYADICLDSNFDHFYMSHMLIDEKDIILGRNVTDAYEVLLPLKYKTLLNRNISVIIGKKLYRLKVVGIYDDEEYLSDEYFYTTIETMTIFYEQFPQDSYNYIFIVDDYDELNSNMDKLKVMRYRVSINHSDNLGRLNSYNTMISVFGLIGFLLIAIIFVNIIF